MTRPLYVLTGLVLAFAAGELYLGVANHNLATDARRTQETLIARISQAREAVMAADHADAVEVELLRYELKTNTGEAVESARRARADAARRAERLAKTLAGERQRQERETAEALGNIQAVTVAAHSAIGELNTEVRSARDEAAATRTQVEQTGVELKRVAGDLGILGGEVATNGRELELLKARGERNYIDFDLKKGRQPQKVGDIEVVVRKTDPKRHRFTIEMVADGRRIEKKDRTVNEPVQLYVSASRRLYEIVVNEVSKDQIRGYLATPRETQVAAR